ncbi:hypothetical protein GTR02_21315, partial [Kineococcus sp. R8]|uniref:cell wall-binding repeat-containing protein n=1 Tax=Kineococcus siccus TaxID=2696567 RepID=UPI00196A9C59
PARRAVSRVLAAALPAALVPVVLVPVVLVPLVLAGAPAGATVPGTYAAQPFAPAGVAVPGGFAHDDLGTLVVSDPGAGRVVRLDAAGRVLSTTTGFTSPAGVAVEADGSVLVADTQAHQVKRISRTGTVTVVAGSGVEGAPLAGRATASPLDHPVGVAVDGLGNVYVADRDNNQVEKVDRTGALTVFAGTGRALAPATGVAVSSTLSRPTGVAVDGVGNVYIADSGYARVEKVDPGGRLSVVAGTGTPGTPVPGPALASPLLRPAGVAVDRSGNVYVADAGGSVVAVSAAGTLSTLAGGTALPAVDSPVAIAVDAEERVHVVDAHDPADAGDDTAFVLTPTEPRVAPHVVSPAPRTAALKAPFAQRFVATGAPTPRWSLIGALPAGLVFDAATGVLSGTPTAKAGTTFTVRATNSQGHDDQVVTLVVDAVPAAPAAPVAVAGDARATLTWTAPAGTGTAAAGSLPVTGYVVLPHRGSTPGTPVQVAAPATTAVVTGLTNGESHTFTVTAVNAVGTGVPSPPSAAVVPTAQGAAVAPAPGTTRLDGPDRVATAVRTSRALFPVAGSARAVVLSTSTRFADALAGARLASANASPLLLTPPDALPADVAAEVQRVLAPAGTVYVLGGPTAVSAATETALATLSARYTVTRLSGADRFATATAVADAVGSTGPLYLADGTDFPDGLAVSALAGRTGGSVLLTDGAVLPAATRAHLAAHDAAGGRTVPVGGAAARAADGHGAA